MVAESSIRTVESHAIVCHTKPPNIEYLALGSCLCYLGFMHHASSLGLYCSSSFQNHSHTKHLLIALNVGLINVAHQFW